jgi:hypothetical protein
MQADGSCPVEWIDVHQQPDACAELDTPLEQVRERLYLKDESGRPPVARLDPDRPDRRTQSVARQMRKRFG